MWPAFSSTSSRFCYRFGILVASLFLRATAEVTCPEGWLTYKDCCYGLFTGKKNWFDAEFDCRRHAARSHLASILDAEEMEAVANFITPINKMPGGTGPIWIGLFDHNQEANWIDLNSPPDPKERDWQWMDAFKVTYLPWAKGEPNNADSFEPCVHLLPQEGFKKWNDIDCCFGFAWLCKYELKYQRG